MINSQTLDEMESFAKEHNVDYGSGNPTHILAARQLQVISELRKLKVTISYIGIDQSEIEKLQEREAAFREKLDFIRLDAGTSISNASYPFDYKLKRIYEIAKEVLARFPEEKDEDPALLAMAKETEHESETDFFEIIKEEK